MKTVEEKLKLLQERSSKLAEAFYLEMGQAFQELDGDPDMDFADYSFLLTTAMATMHCNFYAQIALQEKEHGPEFIEFAKTRAIENISEIINNTIDGVYAEWKKQEEPRATT